MSNQFRIISSINTIFLLVAIFTQPEQVSTKMQVNSMHSQQLEAYTFDFSAHKPPLAYDTYETAIELFTKVKLIAPIKDKYGAIMLKKVLYSALTYNLNSTCNVHCTR